MVEIILAKIGLLLVIAFLTESLTEILKNVLPDGVIKDKLTYGLSIAVGILLTYSFGVNLFGLEGIGKHVSEIAAGILASRGANYVNGFAKKIGILRIGK
jgi:1,4-dihydroxy-2-naphthoate octaprenyltransferase